MPADTNLLIFLLISGFWRCLRADRGSVWKSSSTCNSSSSITLVVTHRHHDEVTLLLGPLPTPAELTKMCVLLHILYSV